MEKSIDRLVDLRPYVTAALGEERFPAASGKSPEETHAMKGAGRGGKIVEQLGELRLDEPVDVEDADGTECPTLEAAAAGTP